MILQDYHMHTTYCDGADTTEEMILAAIEKGLTEVGISGHSHTAFDESYCMSSETTEIYRQELISLREKYAEKISVKIGLEMDFYSDESGERFDYTIGSVHYMMVPFDPAAGVPEGCLCEEAEPVSRVYIPVDETPQILRAAADAYFGGDLIALAEHFFLTAGGVAEKTGCDIIGHFDLITKFNEKGAMFDEADPRYIAAWKNAVDRLLPYDIPFEINTGAISKGYRSGPYPAAPIREYIREKGGRFILSSDSHRTETILFGFDTYESELI